MTRRSFVAAGMSAASLLSLALFGCGNSDGSTDSTSSDQGGSDAGQDSGAFPVTIKHAYGETTIDSKPERVATIFWNNYEPPLALGIAPVGISKSTFGKVDEHGLRPWVTAAYDKLGADYPVLFDDSDGADLEAVNDCQPDVILAPYSGLTEDDYNKLSEIAPVVPFSEKGKEYQTTWRDITKVDGEALGMSDDADKLIKDTEDLIAQKVEEYGTKGQTCAALWFDANDLSHFMVYLPNEVRVDYLKDLGFDMPESVQKLAADTDPSAGFFVTLSSEKADQFSDIQLAAIFGDDKQLAQAQADPLLSVIPAIKNGAVAMLTPDGYMQAAAIPCVLGIPATIDDYLKLLTEAMKKVQA